MDRPLKVVFPLVILGELILYVFLGEVAGSMSNSGTSTDMSEVTWAHAVNSRADLERELAGPVDFLEADVSMGHVKGNTLGPAVPIMAHPPHTVSDVSLEKWVDIVIEKNAAKGVKLDFKSIEVVEPSLLTLQSLNNKVNFTLWLNADILKGPINSTNTPVDETPFLNLCKQFFPNAVISVGWTTRWYPSFPTSWHYEWSQVRKMADVIRCLGYENHYPTFTFPVRGIFASRSTRQLQWLLGIIPGSTLTVWSGSLDPLLLNDLLHIRRSFPKDKVYYDIPERLLKSFMKVKDKEPKDINQLETLKDDQWVVLTHGSDHNCASHTYVSNNTAVFGRSMRTAVLLKKLLFADEKSSLRVTGKVNFFPGYDQPAEGNHELTIVVVDVSLFSKNISTDNHDLNLSGSDTDVLWEALNASYLHTFQHSFSGKIPSCRVFKMDTSEDHSFQAWTVPCEEIAEDKSIEEAIAYGRSEVSSRKRMVLPVGPFMIGFVSSGDGHVAVHDFEINGRKENISGASSVSLSSVTSAAVIGLSTAVGYMVKRYLR